MTQQKEETLKFLGMPVGLWIVIAILLLSGVGIWRVFFRGDSEQVQQVPSAPQQKVQSSEIPTFQPTDNIGGQLFIEGSTSFAGLPAESLEASIRREFPNLLVNYNPTSSGEGIKAVLNGEIEIAVSSRTPTQEEMSKGGNWYPLAEGDIALFANQDIGLEGLEYNALQAVFTGEVSNWSEVGGPDIPIVTIARPSESGTAVTFEDFIGRTLSTSQVWPRDETTAIVREVANTPGAISYAAAGQIEDQSTVSTVPIFMDGEEIEIERIIGVFTSNDLSDTARAVLPLFGDQEVKQNLERALR